MPRFSLSVSLCSLLIIPISYAKTGDQEFIVSAGKGLNNVLMQKYSIASAEMVGASWAYQFFDYPHCDHLQWWLQGGYSYLREQHSGQRQNQHVFELKPVLRWFPSRKVPHLFTEAGIGAGYVANTSFGAIDLTTKLNFSLQFSAGYRFANGYLLSVRYSHFSNGYTNRPNPGFDFSSLNWHFYF